MQEVLDTGKCVVCCTVCVGLAVAGSVTVLAIVLNLVKMVVL